MQSIYSKNWVRRNKRTSNNNNNYHQKKGENVQHISWFRGLIANYVTWSQAVGLTQIIFHAQTMNILRKCMKNKQTYHGILIQVHIENGIH